MTLETLSDSFKPLKLNYSMNKTLMNLPKLIRELQIIKRILKDQRGAHMTVKDSSSSSDKRKKKNNFKNTKQGKFKVGKGNGKGKE